MTRPKVAIIASLGSNRALGKDNDLLWRIKDDLKRFKALTMGHPIIMGRKTYDSIGKPLPGRENIVVTRNKVWKPEGVHIAHTLEDALEKASSLDKEIIFVIGGGEIYNQALPYATKLYLTLVERKQEADTFFPTYEHLFTHKISEENRSTEDGLKYTWLTLSR